MLVLKMPWLTSGKQYGMSFQGVCRSNHSGRLGLKIVIYGEYDDRHPESVNHYKGMYSLHRSL